MPVISKLFCYKNNTKQSKRMLTNSCLFIPLSESCFRIPYKNERFVEVSVLESAQKNLID